MLCFVKHLYSGTVQVQYNDDYKCVGYSNEIIQMANKVLQKMDTYWVRIITSNELISRDFVC